MTIRTNILSEQFSKGRQSLNAERIYCLAKGNTKARIRAKIKSDSYDFQSYAKVDVYSPASLSWNEIGSIPYANMNTPHKLGYQPNATIEHFEKDFEQLVGLAKIVIFD